MQYQITNKRNSCISYGLVSGKGFNEYNEHKEFITSDLNVLYAYRDLVDQKYGHDAPFTVIEARQ